MIGGNPIPARGDEEAMPGEQSIALGAFDRPGDFAVTRQIFVDEKPATYALAGDLVSLTGTEIRAGSVSR